MKIYWIGFLTLVSAENYPTDLSSQSLDSPLSKCLP